MRPFTSRPMKATAEIQAIPIGAGVSVRREVRRAHELLEESGLIIETHASGTNVEGDLSLHHEATASGRVTRRASSDPACSRWGKA